jgi:hypothetical protein
MSGNDASNQPLVSGPVLAAFRQELAVCLDVMHEATPRRRARPYGPVLFDLQRSQSAVEHGGVFSLFYLRQRFSVGERLYVSHLLAQFGTSLFRI